jgi:hypothetical protein
MKYAPSFAAVIGCTSPSLTVFFEPRWRCRLAEDPRIDQSIPIVTESGQITDRRNLRLKSRAQIPDGSARRFFLVRRKILR